MSLEVWGDENPDDADYASWADRAGDAGWFDPDDYSPGAIDILKERERQETQEGWTAQHDDAHDNGEIAEAAACYALGVDQDMRDGLPLNWPWSREWWKPADPDRRKNLVRAGALIAAEIDRLDRLAAKGSEE